MKSFLLVTALIAMLCLSGSATTIDVPGDYGSIQQAIANSSENDTVLVQPGTYYENVNFGGKDIKLLSLYASTGDTSYISQTIIDGDSSGSVVTFESMETGAANLTGFTIQNGLAVSGGGVRITNYAQPFVRHNIIRNNTATAKGGGVSCEEYTMPTISYNTITGNVCDQRGGGIHTEGGVPVITDNIITYNVADRIGDGEDVGGGGINFCESGGSVNDNYISHNQASSGGGIMGYSDFSGVPVAMFQNTIVNNHASSAGGGLYFVHSDAVLSYSTISGNTSDGYAGGVGLYVSDMDIHGNIIWGDSLNFGESEIWDTLSTPLVTFNCIMGFYVDTSVVSADGNFGDNPLFCDAEVEDYTVAQNSPCLTAGTGHNRVGAYDQGCPAIYLSCCTGPSVGNTDGSADNLITMGDLVTLIDHMFITFAPLECNEEGNTDESADGLVTMGDLVALIDHLFITFAPLPACP